MRAYVRDKARNGAWFSIRQLAVAVGRQMPTPRRVSLALVLISYLLLKRLFDEINAGGISWSDPMLDTTVSGCFDRMTIASY